MNNATAFLITAFDQIREVKFTVHMLRELWTKFRTSPIVIVISGDTNRDLSFPDDPITRVVHLDDMVGDKFKTLVSTSIMRQITHGMLEIRDIEREHNQSIGNIVHMHGDILLLGEEGFWKQLIDWKHGGAPVAADTVGASAPVTKELFGREYSWKFFGSEIMPQLFAVDHDFCKRTGFMYNMEVDQSCDFEVKATETTLVANLHRAIHEEGNGRVRRPKLSVNDRTSPYDYLLDETIYVVRRARSQWGLHDHWGGFCHYGNSIHFSQDERETRNEMALRRYGIDLEKW